MNITAKTKEQTIIYVTHSSDILSLVSVVSLFCFGRFGGCRYFVSIISFSVSGFSMSLSGLCCEPNAAIFLMSKNTGSY